MIHKIANKLLTVSVNTLGAEPMSIQLSKENLEYLWQGDPAFWTMRAPTLFPLVGALNNNKYTFGGQEYELELHGFAKTSEFDLIEHTVNQMVFKLSQNEFTLEKYPFKFDLFTTYTIYKNTITISHRVINKNDGEMWFSIGEHPGFNCPLFEGETMEDYSLVFEKKETIQRVFIENGLLSQKQEPFLDNQNEIKLTPELFKRLAIILKGLKSEAITLKSCKHDRSVTLRFAGYPLMGIWSPQTGASFVCIEPWYGVSSQNAVVKELCEKEEIIQLETGKEFECSYSITIK